MQLFIDTADLKEIEKLYKFKLFSGVTTNPSSIAKTGQKTEKIIPEIIKATSGLVFVQTLSNRTEEMIKEAKELVKLDSNRIVIKIPATADGIKTMAELSSEGVKTAATAIYSTEQAITSSLAGATYIIPYIKRMEERVENAQEICQNIVKFFEKKNARGIPLAASFRTAEQVIDMILLGFNFLTVAPDLLLHMFDNKNTSKDVKKFADDYAKLNTNQLTEVKK